MVIMLETLKEKYGWSPEKATDLLHAAKELAKERVQQAKGGYVGDCILKGEVKFHTPLKWQIPLAVPRHT